MEIDHVHQSMHASLSSTSSSRDPLTPLVSNASLHHYRLPSLIDNLIVSGLDLSPLCHESLVEIFNLAHILLDTGT